MILPEKNTRKNADFLPENTLQLCEQKNPLYCQDTSQQEKDPPKTLSSITLKTDRSPCGKIYITLTKDGHVFLNGPEKGTCLGSHLSSLSYFMSAMFNNSESLIYFLNSACDGLDQGCYKSGDKALSCLQHVRKSLILNKKKIVKFFKNS